MIETLCGTITGTSPEGIFLRTGPLEWEIAAGTRTIRRLAKHDGETVRIYTHLVVREDDMRMFGFADRSERGVFRSLLRVAGVGPRQAIKILSAVEADELARLIEAADVEALGRLPGIGKKTAQKVVLSLQGELVTEQPASESPDSLQELIDSLVNMGFDAGAVRNIVHTCAQSPDIAELSLREREQNIFRAALLQLSSSEQEI